MNQGSHLISLDSQPVIRIDGVTRIFRSESIETHALTGVHMAVYTGEFVAISGPSGCGKSTLLSIAGLLDTPTTGQVFLGGRDVTHESVKRRTILRNRHIGFIFQAFNLIGDLTVGENVELPLLYRKLPARLRRKTVMECLKTVNMQHRIRHYPTQLSGGQQQKVALARALVTTPDILLADEPTGNLDSRSSETVMAILRDLNRTGVTICMVTHESKIARYAHRTLHMFDGRIVDETTGVPDET